MTPYDPDDREPTDPRDAHDPRRAAFDPAFDPPSDPRGGSPRGGTPPRSFLSDRRNRLALAAGGALVILLGIVGLWYGDPTNRARRELARANAQIVEKQREVADARRSLAERIAELRAAQAEADLHATRYRSAVDRSTRPPQLDGTFVDSALVDTTVVGGEVVPAQPAPARP